MVSSPRNDLRVVWLLQSRRLVARLEFWLILVGYDLKTHAFSSKLYMLYLIIFFTIWGLAVLALPAGFVTLFLSVLPFGNPLTAAVVVGAIAMISIFLIELFFASRRSPFNFSEADAVWLCSTPLDRRVIALVWFLGAWLVRGLIVWPGFVVLTFGLMEAQSVSGFVISDLPRFILAGLQILLVVVPLHLAVQSLAWSVGAWRLRLNQDFPALQWLVPFLAFAFIGVWVLAGSSGTNPIPFWLEWVTYPLTAGFGAAPFMAGVVLSLVWAVLGLLTLWSTSKQMNLARAAQETRGQEIVQTALLTGSFDLVDEIRQRDRLGAGRNTSQLPVRPGLSTLLWRNAIQVWHSRKLRRIFVWLGIFGLTLGIIISPDWGTRMWTLIFWALLAGQELTWFLSKDLKRWWLMRQLPFTSEKLIIADLFIPGMSITVITTVSLLIASGLGMPGPITIGWLLLPGAAVLGMAAVLDILRKCKSERLLAGVVPGLSLLTFVLTAVILLIPGGVAWLAMYAWSIPAWIALPLALSLILFGAYGLYRLAGSRLRDIH